MIRQTLRFLESHTWLLYMMLLAVTLTTLLLTLLPADQVSGPDLFKYDKIGHALMFGSWTFFLGLLLLVNGQQPLPLFSIFLAGAFFGVSVEILQEVLPSSRNMDVGDMIADIVGCLMAVVALSLLQRRAES